MFQPPRPPKSAGIKPPLLDFACYATSYAQNPTSICSLQLMLLLMPKKPTYAVFRASIIGQGLILLVKVVWDKISGHTCRASVSSSPSQRAYLMEYSWWLARISNSSLFVFRDWAPPYFLSRWWSYHGRVPECRPVSTLFRESELVNFSVLWGYPGYH